jgi:hypothetical protein
LREASDRMQVPIEVLIGLHPEWDARALQHSRPLQCGHREALLLEKRHVGGESPHDACKSRAVDVALRLTLLEDWKRKHPRPDLRRRRWPEPIRGVRVVPLRRNDQLHVPTSLDKEAVDLLVGGHDRRVADDEEPAPAYHRSAPGRIVSTVYDASLSPAIRLA